MGSPLTLTLAILSVYRRSVHHVQCTSDILHGLIRFWNRYPFRSSVRAMQYSSTYAAFKREEAHIYMALLLNKYPLRFILRELKRVPRTFQYGTPT